jgi:hypothetical protein
MIVLGTVSDSIPESMVIGLTILQRGQVGAAYLAAVLVAKLLRPNIVQGRSMAARHVHSI